MATFQRTTVSPRGYEMVGAGRATPLNNIYVGFVKALDDKKRMGRIKVWIPELGGEPYDQSTWYTCNYASPFAGATNVFDNTNGDRWEDTQRSYGMWFVPPDVENEVLVCFINGDPGRGTWFACLYQQNMNNMVPGLSSNNGEVGIPVAEYNKLKVSGNVNIETINRPVYGPLADQLAIQGLDKDDVRGISGSSARRNNPINAVYGILTPGGTQVVLDDNPQQRFIRLRTRNGAQLLINDSIGNIYMNSRDGKNWVEMAAGGEIDIYAMNDISIRSQTNLNIRADLDVNIEAGRNINIKARNDGNTTIISGNSVVGQGGFVRVYGVADVDIASAQDVHVRADQDVGITAKRNKFDYAYQNYDFKAGGYMHLTSNGDMAIKTPANFLMAGNVIHLNGPPTPDSVPAPDATEPYDLIQKDNYVESDANFKFITRRTILYRLPYHEPFSAHAAQTPGTNNHVEEDPGPKYDPYNGSPIRDGSIVPNQTRPLDIQGSPRAGMKPGKYSGDSYDASGSPVYKYEGSSTDLKAAGGFQISESGIEFIKRYEGVRYTAYNDVAGLRTIGVGHLLTKEELQGNYVKIGSDKISADRSLTDQQVNDLLKQDLEPKMQTVRNAIKANITQSQFDMLVSLCFNIGQGAFKSSTVVRVINQGNFDQVPNAFMMWVKAGGKVVQGLVNRRQAEAANFRGARTAPA